MTLISGIAADDPAAIAYDVLFADERAGDPELTSALAAAPVVLASALTLEPRGGPALIVESVEPTDELAAAAAEVGHANVSLTPRRGVARSLPLYAVDDRGVVTPSLALATVAVVEGASAYTERPNGIQTGSRFIPLDGGDLRINWANALSDQSDHVSAVDVLDGDVPAGTFTDRTVVVGVTEPTLGDLHLVPLDKSGNTSGLLIHANAINTILTESYLDDASLLRQSVLIAAVAIIAAVAFVWLPLRLAAAIALVEIALAVALTTWRFHHSGEFWNVVWPIGATIVVALSGSAARYVGEIRHRRRAVELFASYVPDITLDRLSDPRALARAIEGERLEASVLFCDLRGFTPIAATLTPAEVRTLLDIFYEYAVGIIQEFDGTVLQFVGDEVFGAFGAPLESPDDAPRAVAAALALVDRVADFDLRLDDRSLPAVRFGVGVHRGGVVAAHVGSAAHRQYTLIGDPVNVASRLCGQAGAGEVVVSDDAAGSSDTTGLNRIDDLELKGVDRPVGAWRHRAVGAPTTGA